jgi:hypothetical protein
MGNLFGLDEQTFGDIRLNGIGWIAGILVVGASILAARFLVDWQVRRIERLLARKDAAQSGEDKGPGGQHESTEG